MSDPRRSRSHAADSAPGVGDGPAGVRAPAANSKPRGRGVVWIGILLVLAVIVVSFFARPMRSGNPRVETGATQAEIDASRVPGTADRLEANRPVSQQGQGG
jgi:hypothetical protein